MLSIIVGVIAIVLLAGLLAKWYLDRLGGFHRISWFEYGVTAAIATLVVIPTSTFAGWKLGQSAKMTFTEHWNGWEQEAILEVTQCYRDGSCRWTYDCDPYIVMESYSCNCDNKGNCSTCYRPETRYHSCPFCSEEWSFYIQTSVGQFTIDEHRFPDSPLSHVWRAGENPSQGVIERAGVGRPRLWQEAKARLDSNAPGPVSVTKTYPNYVLASNNTVFREYEGDIQHFLTAKLLPSPKSDIFNFYKTNKAYFIGVTASSYWQERVHYLNAALGSRLQGDMRLVVVKNPTINAQPDRYVNALKSYWLSWDFHKDYALSKNALVIVIGTTDGETVAWSRAFTGMPTGNELLLTTLRNHLKGLPLTADTLLGNVKADRAGRLAVSGAIAEAVLTTPATKFKRVEMKYFSYLKGEIQPTPTAKKWTFAVALIIGLLTWTVAIVMDDFKSRQKTQQSWRTTSRYYR